jgi:RNA polymerase sigma-70 factor (ECF subfamily)
MTGLQPDTEELLRQAAAGDDGARGRLLDRHRVRLLQLVTVRLDRRLLGRLDPSDVVQEVLLQAHRELDRYLRDRPLPFYPWLRQLAWQRLVKLFQHHQAQKRRVSREQPLAPGLPDESVWELARQFVVSETSPVGHLLREELRRRVREALACLAERDREVLLLRYLEQMSTREIAAVLGTSEGVVKMRHARALLRLQAVLGEGSPES